MDSLTHERVEGVCESVVCDDTDAPAEPTGGDEGAVWDVTETVSVIGKDAAIVNKVSSVTYG